MTGSREGARCAALGEPHALLVARRYPRRMARHPLARRRTSSPWRVSIGVVAALGCSAPATRPSAAGAGATMAATSQVELTPSLAAVFARVVRLPVMVQPSASVRGNPEYYKNFESTATDAQLAEARALAADCAGQIAEWRRGREAQAERAIPIAGLPYPYGDGREWTPESAQHTCEEARSGNRGRFGRRVVWERCDDGRRFRPEREPEQGRCSAGSGRDGRGRHSASGSSGFWFGSRRRTGC